MTEKTIYTVFIRGYYCTEALKILLQLIFHIQNGTDSFNKVASPSGSSGSNTVQVQVLLPAPENDRFRQESVVFN